MPQQTKLGKTATTISRDDDGRTVVTYHSTPVVAFDRELVTLDSGGYHTATTKTRMNQAASQFGLGFLVFQKGGDWFVRPRTLGDDLDFFDGITFNHLTGQVIHQEAD